MYVGEMGNMYFFYVSFNRWSCINIIMYEYYINESMNKCALRNIVLLK